MAKTIIIMTGSVRPQSVSEALLPLVQKTVEATGAQVYIANLKELALPFFDGNTSPADEKFQIPHASVQSWSDMVSQADGIIMLTPEYNHQLSGVQKNAIDWLYREWQEKPIAAVCYGWGGAELSGELLKKLIAKVGGTLVEPWTHLFFTKDIAPGGVVLDEANVTHQLTATVNALVAQ